MSTYLFSGYDFGYAWPWVYGHLIPIAIFAAAGMVAWRLRWRRLSVAAILLACWGVAGLSIVHAAFRINRPIVLPTANFLASGSGRVLDAGAGSGRSALMVLLARPQARVVALDNFSADYIRDNGPGRLHANARVAGVDERLEVQAGDMRKMPLESESFDGVVSAFAIDHLSRNGIVEALAEVRRVMKPSGEFLLMIGNGDRWVKVAYPLVNKHMYYGIVPPVELWKARLTKSGFDVREVGTQPATLYFLCRKQ